MASAPQSTEVEREAMCPICLECLTDPVTLDCRHNFCRSCITGYCQKRAKVKTVRCPLCKTRIQKGTLQPNWQLSNIVEKIKLGKSTQGKENMCKKHHEKLQLFCKEDEELVCLICEHSPEHNQHSVLLLEKAVQEYRDKIKLQQKSLEKDRGNLVDRKLVEELKCQECLEQLEAEKQKVSSVFQQLHTFLEEKEDLWLSQLDELKKEIEEKHEENATKLSKEVSRLNKWIKKMERKCQQPAGEFLQNIGSTLKNYENKEIGHTVVLSPGLEEIIRICSQKNAAIEKITEKYKEEAVRLTESYEAAMGTYSAPVTGPAKKANCRPPGPLPHGIALKPSGLRLTFQGERTSRTPTLPLAYYVGLLKEPKAWAGKLPAAIPTLPLCCTCGQPGHIKWDCPFMDCLQANVRTSTQAWRENDGLSTEAEDDDLDLQGSEAGQCELERMLTPDQEQQQAKFWTWTKGAVAPPLEECACEVLCHHNPAWRKMLGHHSAPSCANLAKTPGLSANDWQLELQGFKGWDQVQGGDIKESVGAPEGVQARKVEGCKGAGEAEDRGNKMPGESRVEGRKTQQEVGDGNWDLGEETQSPREERGRMEKDQVPSLKGREGDKGTSDTEARGRSREEGFRTVSGFRKGEPGGEGAGKEIQDDQEQQGERLQGQEDSLGSSSSKDQGVSKGGRSRRLGQGLGLRLSGYSWSLGRGYKIIGYPLPRRAPVSTPAGTLELSSLGGCPDTFKSPAKNTKPSGRGVPSEEIFRPC
ncbi:uncharacterized protein [Tiliqua scincoides]|uniref:uncharacterized protein n=1 Tax=Tiliqua scincoides TaxID=71010 RepID=UPI0034630616